MITTERPVGTLIKYERLPKAFWPSHAAVAYRIFYQGMGFHGGRTLVAGSVFIPSGMEPGPGWPVVAYAHGTTGLCHRVAPSRTGLSKPERAHVNAWLDAGYAVAATDYEGMINSQEHPYFNGEAAADDIIDAVRAAHALPHRLSPVWIAAGFSQGGHAAGFAAIVASGYAPELDFRGTATFGPIVGLREMFRRGTENGLAPAFWLAPVFLAGIPVAYPGVAAEDFLTPKGMELVKLAKRGTLKEIITAASEVTNDEAGLTGLADRGDLCAVIDRVEPPASALDRPMMVTAGHLDEIIPLTAIEPYVAEMREAGSDVGFYACPDSNHAGILSGGLSAALSWAASATGNDAVPVPNRFGLLDVDGNGFLRRADFRAFALRLVQAVGEAPRSAKAEAVREGYTRLWLAFANADVNADSAVTEAEYRHWLAVGTDSGHFESIVEPLARAVIGLADTNGDEILSSAEFTALLQACRYTEAEAHEIFGQLDTDGSGSVTAQELVAAIRDFCRGDGMTGHWLFGPAKRQ